MAFDGARAYPEPGGDLGIGRPGQRGRQRPARPGSGWAIRTRPATRSPPPARHRGGFLGAECGTALHAACASSPSCSRPDAVQPAIRSSFHRPDGKPKLLPGSASRRKQRQPAPGAPLIDQQAAEGLQRFGQAQAVAGLELPGQRLVAVVGRRCRVAHRPGQPAQVMTGAGGIRRQAAVQSRGRSPARTSYARRRGGLPARPARRGIRSTRPSAAARRRRGLVARPDRGGRPHPVRRGQAESGPGARCRASR